MEKWAKIDGLNYYVSSKGRVRNSNGLILRVYLNKGYHNAIFCCNGKTNNRLLHRLVALSFLPNPDKKRYVNHKNGIKTDNQVENLEWATASENTKHAIAMGLSNNPVGSKNVKAKMDEVSVQILREAYASGLKLKDIAAYFKIQYQHASTINTGKFWRHVL